MDTERFDVPSFPSFPSFPFSPLQTYVVDVISSTERTPLPFISPPNDNFVPPLGQLNPLGSSSLFTKIFNPSKPSTPFSTSSQLNRNKLIGSNTIKIFFI